MSARAKARFPGGSLHGLAYGLALLAIAAHVPGHVSMDSSEQLYEALTGQSVSWSPPFMSALLRLFGGGLLATTLFVIASVLLTYVGMSSALAAGTRVSSGQATSWRWLRFAAIALLIANPLVFLHVGIVWKDVLLAALLASSAGLLLLSEGRPEGARRGMCIVALLLLVPLLLVRQQGILLAPPLLAVAAAGIAGKRNSGGNVQWWLRWVAVVATYVLLCGAVSTGVRQLVKGTDDKSTAIGFAAVQRYDLTGLMAVGGKPATVLPTGLATPGFLAAVQRSYSADRIDFVLNDPEVVAGFWGLEAEPVAAAWRSLIMERPGVYLEVKARQFAWLIGLHRLDKCLPLHVGVEGNDQYLQAVGITSGLDRYDQQLYQLGMWSRHLVLYRHWFYLAILLACAAYLAASWKRGRAPGAADALAIGLLAYYGSYAATTIACDFRYLYPGLVGTSVLAIHLLARGRIRGGKAGEGT